MCAESASPEWTDRSQKLSNAWLGSFERAVAKLDQPEMKRLFHPMSVTFGGSKYGPCGEFDALNFSLNVQEAKILPLDRAYAQVLVEWKVKSPVIGGTPTRGFATLLLYITEPEQRKKGSVQCVHAHFSRQ